jgi:TonB family protein
MKTNLLVSLLIAIGVIAIQGCSVQPAKQSQTINETRMEEMRRVIAPSNGQGQVVPYAQTIAARIKSHTMFVVPKDVVNDPVEYEVKIYPDGMVESIAKLKSSSVPGFDQAVMSAIEASQPFPPDNAGIMPSGFTFSHRPKSIETVQKNARPIYPALSRQRGEQGRTVLNVLVDKAGFVKELQIERSSGYPRLDQAAVDAVKTWRFMPRKADENTIESWLVVPINFRLEEIEK